MLGLRIPLRNVSKNSRFQFISGALGIGKLEMWFITEHEFQEIREIAYQVRRDSIEFNVRADNGREIARRLRRTEDALQTIQAGLQVQTGLIRTSNNNYVALHDKMGKFNETMLLVIEGQKVLNARFDEFIKVKKIWE